MTTERIETKPIRTDDPDESIHAIFKGTNETRGSDEDRPQRGSTTQNPATPHQEATTDLEGLVVRRANRHSSHHRSKELHLTGLFGLKRKGKENKEGG